MTDPHRPLKDAFSCFGTGIAVATCLDRQGLPLGITVNSFTSVSLTPPLVLWCIDRNSGVFAEFAAASHYGISLLRGDQKALSDRFATPGSHSIKRDEYQEFHSGAPILTERLAGFDCQVVDRIDAGDHVILIGRIESFDSNGGKPLLYVQRNYIEAIENKTK